MERKWRNFMIALATSIGFTGILISFGLGNAIIHMINKETDNGQLPAQVQISLNSEVAGTGVLNVDDEQYITEVVGQERIKYLESPFGIVLKDLTIDELTLDMSTSFPSYAQVVSLFDDSDIAVSANNEDDVLYGELYQNHQEKGLTIPITLIDAFNQTHHTNYTYDSFLGKAVSATIFENTHEGERTGTITTKITRIIEDEFEDSNSYMAPVEMERILQEQGFSKNVPYMILELKDSSQTELVVEQLKEHKKYTILSQQVILGMIINFIRVIQGLLVVMSSQAILVSVVMIGVIVYINIMQRSREIGVMKTVGYQNSDIKAIFVTEAMVITFVSLAISFVCSMTIGFIANLIVAEQFPKMGEVFRLDVTAVVGMVILAVLVGVISAYFPTLKISQLDPVESLRYE